MKRILQIKNGVVQADWFGSGGAPVPPDDSWTFIDATNRPDIQVGDHFDNATQEFSKPAPPPDYGLSMSPRGFMQLFSTKQRIAIRAATKSDPVLEDFMSMVAIPEPIRLKHPTTQRGLQYLESKGLITRDDRLRMTDGVALAE